MTTLSRINWFGKKYPDFLRTAKLIQNLIEKRGGTQDNHQIAKVLECMRTTNFQIQSIRPEQINRWLDSPKVQGPEARFVSTLVKSLDTLDVHLGCLEHILGEYKAGCAKRRVCLVTKDRHAREEICKIEQERQEILLSIAYLLYLRTVVQELCGDSLSAKSTLSRCKAACKEVNFLLL